MRTMKVVVLMAAVVAVALSAHTPLATATDVDGDALLSMYENAMAMPSTAVTGKQRALLHGRRRHYGRPPVYGSPSPKPVRSPKPCANANIKNFFTVKVAVLMIGTYSKPTVTSGDYVKVVKKRIESRIDRYVQKYDAPLGYGIRQNTNGSASVGKQKWFYYDIDLIVGNCGNYKLPLVTQLRGDIKASASFIRRVRILDYPFKQP